RRNVQAILAFATSVLLLCVIGLVRGVYVGIYLIIMGSAVLAATVHWVCDKAKYNPPLTVEQHRWNGFLLLLRIAALLVVIALAMAAFYWLRLTLVVNRAPG